MKIFISYASEQKSVAESIAYSLRSRGHQVFLDRDDLPPGSSYDDQIERAIMGSDCLVFLITPQSVERGRYTLTELAHARRRWRKPARRVLPVMVEATPLTNVPNFLKGVTILEPMGNLTAEVSAAVHALGVPQRSVWTQTAQAAALAVAGFLGIGLLLSVMFARAVEAGPVQEPALNAFLLACLFSLPMAMVLATFGAQHAWRALTAVLCAIPVISLITQDSEVTMQLFGVTETSSFAMKTAYAFTYGAVTGALLTLAILIAASFASPEFRSPSRWAATLIIMCLIVGLTMLPFGAQIAITATTETQTYVAALMSIVWIATMGAFLGYWMAVGEPGLDSDAAPSDAAAWK